MRLKKDCKNCTKKYKCVKSPYFKKGRNVALFRVWVGEGGTE